MISLISFSNRISNYASRRSTDFATFDQSRQNFGKRIGHTTIHPRAQPLNYAVQSQANSRISDPKGLCQLFQRARVQHEFHDQVQVLAGKSG